MGFGETDVRNLQQCLKDFLRAEKGNLSEFCKKKGGVEQDVYLPFLKHASVQPQPESLKAKNALHGAPFRNF